MAAERLAFAQNVEADRVPCFGLPGLRRGFCNRSKRRYGEQEEEAQRKRKEEERKRRDEARKKREEEEKARAKREKDKGRDIEPTNTSYER